MSEPHQRTKSGKLGKPTLQTKTQSIFDKQTQESDVTIGIDESTELDLEDSDLDTDHYLQTPTTLTQLHISILKQLQEGYTGVKGESIDKYWRRTWSIGGWHLPDKLSISANIMQPNISGCWLDIVGTDIQTITDYAEELKKLNLPNSKCHVQGVNTIKVQGRWALNLGQRLLDDKVLTKDQITISTLNISGSKIFFWLILNTGSQYLCTLTIKSTQILSKYIPDWCCSISEVNSANNFSIRIKNPSKVNDASQLIINRMGFVQYTGKADNIKLLCEALSISINSTIKSSHLKLFLQSLSYKTKSATSVAS